MGAGIAAGLLVFTGVWHATEWMMDGRRRDTWMLVPFGLLYLALGGLIAAGTGGAITQAVALAAVLGGGSLALLMRGRVDLRRWVLRAFIGLDAVIALGLISALLG
ncbi:hypothetical protein PSA7680_01523 [Pseudoruegeria aquimaris]|uniref:Uncharacterized protein n=1 Tax=Pseudoruegeria aquimaris TaxID=393663 RepID=A0A1Y5S6Z1_9RHOB|nr:hypothetical protein [Pseudoruegeria aquimaris]SLN31553.1 hypothetical protein PSA7680_01523 [Pseudoruegeria aquimaris]